MTLGPLGVASTVVLEDGKISSLAAMAIFFVFWLVFALPGVLIYGIRHIRRLVGWTFLAGGAYSLTTTVLIMFSPRFIRQNPPPNIENLDTVILQMEKMIRGWPVAVTVSVVLALIGAALIWWDKAAAGTTEQATAADPRPGSLRFIAWFTIITGSISLLATPLNFRYTPSVDAMRSMVKIDLNLYLALMAGLVAVDILCAVFWLKGRNWSRLLWAVTTPLTIAVVPLVVTSNVYYVVYGLVWYGVIMFILYRKPADRFFRGEGRGMIGFSETTPSRPLQSH